MSEFGEETFSLGIVNSSRQATMLSKLIRILLDGQTCFGNFQWCCH
jgi:predicted metal-binding transcription factor (methanogenesis marker protein 9)